MVRRQTAVLRLGGAASAGDLRALDVQRLYPYDLIIDGRASASGSFASPLGDQAWRDFTAALGEAVDTPTEKLAERRYAFQTVRSAGRQLFFALAEIHPALRTFLADAAPRRLVVLSAHPELHALPWEALVDEHWRHPACRDLSIVHAYDVFETAPEPVQPPVTIAKIIGPDTRRLTETPLDELLAKAARRREPRVRAVARGEAASLVHVEAHGDPRTGTIGLADADFFDEQRASAMVLLWSCVSNLIQPWGESLAMKLHRQDNRLVLGFTTPVREDTAGMLAEAFYRGVFDGHPPGDPESIITGLRARLYSEARLRACEWAAVSVWLRGAVDFDAAVLDGPRWPARAWTADAPQASTVFVRDQIRRYAAGGRAAVVPGVALPPAASDELASEYRGAAFHLRHHAWDADLDACLALVAARPRSGHPADRLLALVDASSSYPKSLLLWSGVRQREVDALRWLTSVPSSLSIVLVASSRVEVPVGLIETETGPDTAGASASASPPDLLTELEAREAAGEYNAVTKDWESVAASAGDWDVDRRRRLYAIGYWSFIRLGNRGAAEKCVLGLEAIAPVEAALLGGNLAMRDRRPEDARTQYSRAEKLAAGNARDEGRALLERAYVAKRRSDGGADVLYREAASRLEAFADRGDPQWRSALGRALRDYADLLADDTHRLDEADAHLRRALLIHALDGRMSQVAVALQTRGKIERARRRFREADEAIGAAAALQHQFGNVPGWLDAMRELIEVALEAGEAGRAIALADAVMARLPPDDRDRGRVAALAARACWQLGDLAAARRRADAALNILASSNREERITVSIIRDIVRTLGA